MGSFLRRGWKFPGEEPDDKDKKMTVIKLTVSDDLDEADLMVLLEEIAEKIGTGEMPMHELMDGSFGFPTKDGMAYLSFSK